MVGVLDAVITRTNKAEVELTTLLLNVAAVVQPEGQNDTGVEVEVRLIFAVKSCDCVDEAAGVLPCLTSSV